MKTVVRGRIFSSKVAKRVFGLFILSAFIPIITISFISFNQISGQLDDETRHQLHRESKAYGFTIFDRLTASDTQLKIIANELQRGIDPDVLTEDKWLRSIFNALFIIDDRENNSPIFGDISKLEEIQESQLKQLANGETVLQFLYHGNQEPKIFLMRTIQKERNKNEYLIGEINGKYLWDYGIYEPDIACVLNKSGYVLYCSITVDMYERKSMFDDLINTSERKSINYWNYKDLEYALDIWNLFLDAVFHNDDILVLMAIPRRTAFSEFEHYKSVFPKAIFISVLIVILLSISQIRRYLIPLEKLTEGTNNISSGIFDKPVDIQSGDEFETLGDSFNNMAKQIDEQIKTITTLAEIDQLILSSFDTNYIIETIIKHLHSVTHVHYVCVITIEDITSGIAASNINIDDNIVDIQTENIFLSNQEITELESCNNYLLFNDNDERSYIQKPKNLGDKSFLAYPVNIKGRLSGILILSSSIELDFSEDKLRKLKELSDRVAVALSNAAWEEKLYDQAHYDLLTGLPNRFLFRDRAEQALEHAKREKSFLAVLFIDLDSFKDVNDSLGHAAGDEVLIQLANVLKKCIRSYDTVARFGGDEFAILISDIKIIEEMISYATKLTDRILEYMEKPFILNNREIYMTPSIGIAVYPRDADNFDNLLKNADSAMYSAKAKGRGNYEFYEMAYNAIVLERLELGNELKHAIERNELDLYYQPKIDCKTGQIVAAEALIRWQHPKKGQISPGKFIPIAQAKGIIVPIGYWVLETACMQNKNWIEKGKFDVVIAVNLSADQFRQADLYRKIEEVLVKHDLPAKNLELEITEGVAVENYQKTIDILNKFMELGISIAIDDFGTGYSSMSYLQKLPINRLKIDQSFIRNLPYDIDSLSIVKAIIALAHSMDLSVTAEGVETTEQYTLLQDLNCDELQGFVICPPLPAKEFEQFISEKTVDNNRLRIHIH